jgi:hypothetical protein
MQWILSVGAIPDLWYAECSLLFPKTLLRPISCSLQELPTGLRLGNRETMEIANVHVAVQTAFHLYVLSSSYLTINIEAISFVFSFLRETFGFHRGKYKDTVF